MRSRFVGFLAILGVAGLLIVSAAPSASFGTPVPRGLGIRCPTEFCGRLFVIAVGVDGKWGKQYVSESAESDAARFARRLVWEEMHLTSDTTRRSRYGAVLPLADSSPDAQKALSAAIAAYTRDDTASASPYVALLTGDSATPANVERAFARVIARARPTDAFAFYFGGFSRDIVDSATGSREHYFRLAGRGDFGSNADLRSGGMSSGQLRYWIDNIAATKQLLAVEAGSATEFLSNFVASMIEQNDLASRLTARQRVILGPRKFGREYPKLGGLLSHLIARAPSAVLEVFSRPATVSAAMALVASRDVPDLHEEYFRLFDERDFLDVYRAVAARSAPAPSRGFEAKTEEEKTRARAGRNTALIIGIDRYDAAANWKRLVNPTVDASAVARELATNFGFDTLVLRDPTRDDILSALVGLTDREYGDQDQVLVFFAGHGYYDEKMKMGHLVARDSRPLAEDRFKQSYLSHGMLAQYLEAIPAEHVLVVLDACFGGAFADDVAGGGRSDTYADAELAVLIQRKLEHRSRLYITSGGKEYVSDGRPNQHSPFARRFLATLRDAASENRLLTRDGLFSGVEFAQPGPKRGEFGTSEPGGDFLLIPRSLLDR